MAKAAPVWDVDQHCWSRAERQSAELPTTLREQGTGPADATILNISVSGCLIETKRDMRLGCVVSLGIAGLGCVAAHVVRREEDRYGCAFERILPDAALTNVGAPTVVQFSVRDDAYFPDVATRWPPALRLLIAFGTAGALWALILALV